MMAKPTRDTSLDLISGLLIIHMILGHTMGYPFIKTANILEGIFFFYMPWFFFKSGMFFKPDTDIKNFTKKKFERLIKPFIFFSLIGELLFFVDSFLSGVPLSNWYYYLASTRALPYLGHFTGNPPCWFLFSLFVILVAYNWLLAKWNKYVLVAILCALLFVNHYFNPFPIHSVTHTVSGCLFFVLGLILKEIQYKKVVFFASLLVVLLSIPFNSFIIMVTDLLLYGNYGLWYMFSLCAIVVINNVAKFVPKEIFISKFFVWVGQNSMLLLVVHWIILIALKIVLLNTSIIHEAWQFVLISVAIIAVLTPIINNIVSKLKFIKL